MHSNDLPINVGHLVEDEATEHDEEARLVERAKVDREARGELYRRHYPAIFRFVHRRIGNPHDFSREMSLRARNRRDTALKKRENKRA